MAIVTRKIRIAVNGGGLAGAALVNALFRQSHLDVQLYESAAEFSGRGMAIGMAINAQRALARLVSDAEALTIRAGAVQMHSTRIMIGSGPLTGTKVIDLAEEHPGKMLHRAALLHELLAPIPREKMHARKKLAAVEEQPGGDLLLRFADGSTAETDVLVGVDGIFGFVRSYLLGADHPAVRPVAAGWLGSHALVPYARAREALGAELLEDGDRQYGWVGQGSVMIHDVLSNRQMAQVIATCVDRNPSADRRTSVDREYLQANFADWLDGPMGKGVIDLILTQENPAAYAQWELPDAPTYSTARVCVAGDAAHAMTPWQGSGGAMALEEAVVLGALFAEVKNPDQIASALAAYDAVRRPRTQRVAASSRLTGRIMTGLVEEVGLDPGRMHDALKDRWNFIYDFSLEEHIC